MSHAALLEAAREQKPRMIFVTSPNNPDGSLVPDEDLQALLQLPALIVLDEAYIEFADHPSRAGWVGKHSNLIVLRTFSKSAGLAGIRVGWGCFPPELVIPGSSTTSLMPPPPPPPHPFSFISDCLAVRLVRASCQLGRFLHELMVADAPCKICFGYWHHDR